jgi:hypothetical protein
MFGIAAQFSTVAEKNEIKLLIRDDNGKLKVEDWPITGTVALNPPA